MVNSIFVNLEEMMKELKSIWQMIFVAVVFSVTIAFSMFMNPETISMEPFMQAAIATFLGGIYIELRKMNKQKTESNNYISEHIHKNIT